MATLKGKWLFNENISVPDADIEQAVNFTTSGTIDGTEYSVLNCKSMLVDVSSAELLQYKVESAEPEWEWRERYDAAYCNGLLGFYGFVDQGLRHVDFGAADQEVSEEFYSWFAANAAPVANGKKIAGVWKFKDEIAAPIGGVASGGVNFTTEALGYTAHCIDLYVGEYPEMTYVVDSVPGELEQYLGSLGIALPFPFVVVNGGTWDVDSFGEGIKTIDFGTEPQTVSNEFYGWMIANAERQDPPAATITHNGETIAELDHGQTATLKCAGMKMAGDVVVTVAVESSGGGSAEFNIAYGDTEPTDTSKLWVKTSEPAAVNVTAKAVSAGEEVNVVNATLPDGADSISAAAVGTKVYLFGGSPGVMKYLSTINVFDTEADTISTLGATLPIAITGMAAAAVGTKVYLFGGSNGNFQSAIYVFDTETNTINTLSTTLPAVRDDMAAAAVGTKVYLFGGGTTGPKVVSTIYVFDAETETISNLSATLPKAAEKMAAAVVGTKVYLFGGYNNGVLSGIYVFDTDAQTISTSTATLPVASRGMAAVTIGTKVYLFGGAVSGGYSSAIYVFDPETDTISTLGASLPVETELMAAATIGTSAYLFGGYKALSGIYNFSVSIPLATNTLMVEVYGTKNLFSLLPNVELGVANVYKGNADGYGEKVPAALYVDGAWTEV